MKITGSQILLIKNQWIRSVECLLKVDYQQFNFLLKINGPTSHSAWKMNKKREMQPMKSAPPVHVPSQREGDDGGEEEEKM